MSVTPKGRVLLTRRSVLAAASLLAAPAILAGRKAYAAFPERAVRIVVPYPPGGVSDTTARILADILSDQWGQSVTVENRSGAGGIVGTDAFVRMEADGHNLCLAGTAHSVNPATQVMPYDTMADIDYITTTSRTPQMLTVSAEFPADTAEEFIDYVRARPGELSYVVIGSLGMDLFADLLGLEMNRVSYSGGSEAHPDLIANRVNVMLDSVPATMAHVNDGRLKILAGAGPTRAPQYPDIPTLDETVLPGFTSTVWGIFMAPAGTPPEAIEQLNRDVVAALQRPEVVERHATLGAEVWTSTPEEARQFVADEIEKWSAAARAVGITPG